MCRHLAYLGPPLSLRRLLYDPPYSLHRQSWAPRHQPVGRLNADGFGVGWYADARAEPACYRRAQPMWTDASFASVAGVVESGAVLAAVRSATPGFPVEESATAPFATRHWLFSHNGAVADWESLAAGVLDARVDSAALWALTRQRLDAGASLGTALCETVVDVLAVTTGRLNLLLTDGVSVAATAYGDSLFVRRDDGLTVASEPFDDDPAWAVVPPGSLLTGDAAGVRITSLPVPPPSVETTAAPGAALG